MAKRDRSSPVTAEAEAKQRKLDKDGDAALTTAENEAEEILRPFLNDLEKVQKALQDLDDQCAKKQMEVQKEFDVKKKPIFEQRQAVLDKIPGFWGTAIKNHHLFGLMTEHDEPILKCLKRIELDDNLDDNGSYRIKFIFSDEAKKHFSPLELVKEVRFSRDGPGDEEVVEATEVVWVDQKKNPVAMVAEERAKDDEEDSDNSPWSIFEWFTREVWPETRPDVGEAIRREIWHTPLAFYLGDAMTDDDEDSLSDEISDQSDSDNDDNEDEE